MIGRLLSLVLLLLAALLAVLIYRLISPPEADPIPRSASTLGPVPDTSQIDAQVEAMRAQAERAIEQTQVMARQIDEQRARAVFINDFALTTVLKVAMSDCYLSNGVWPLDGCGVDPDDLRGKLLERVSFEPDGVYLLHFKADLGLPEITVRMQGKGNSAGVRWHCSSADYAGISRLLADCEYLGDAEASRESGVVSRE
jgi:hypothetical protein